MAKGEILIIIVDFFEFLDTKILHLRRLLLKKSFVPAKTLVTISFLSFCLLLFFELLFN